MTPQEQTKQKIEVMQAFLDDKEVEWRDARLINSKWTKLNPEHTIDWNWEENDYRVKPEVETTHNFKVGDKVIYKCECDGSLIQEINLEKIREIKRDTLILDFHEESYDELIRVDDALWYWEYQHKNGLWCITSCRFTKEGIIKYLSEYGATTLTPLYALGARLPESEAKDD